MRAGGALKLQWLCKCQDCERRRGQPFLLSRKDADKVAGRRRTDHKTDATVGVVPAGDR